VDSDLADARLRAAQGEVAGEVPRFVGGAEGGGEHKLVVLPYIASPCAVRGLALGTELERSQADVGKRKDRLGTRGLGFAMEQLAA
jgi:hypothetical protein